MLGAAPRMRSTENTATKSQHPYWREQKMAERVAPSKDQQLRFTLHSGRRGRRLEFLPLGPLFQKLTFSRVLADRPPTLGRAFFATIFEAGLCQRFVNAHARGSSATTRSEGVHRGRSHADRVPGHHVAVEGGAQL